jgi:hypothetical protein
MGQPGNGEERKGDIGARATGEKGSSPEVGE